MFQKLSVLRENLLRVSLYYAVKASKDKHLIDLVLKNECGFDVASQEEMKSLIQRGVDKTKLVYANPTRPIEHLKYAQENQARDFS